jgi:hypothetical protein
MTRFPDSVLFLQRSGHFSELPQSNALLLFPCRVFATTCGGSAAVGASSCGSVTFAADTGTLKLDDSASFNGTVAGMTGSDTIDFADIDPTKVQTPSYTGDASGGTLSVTDGTHSANIALLGNYLASTFVPTSDGHGGTAVIDPAVLGGVAPLVTPPHT